MFPPIALFSSLIILVGQIPGYSVSGGLIQSKNSGKPSSSADKHYNENYNPVPEVQQLLYGRKPYEASQSYRETIESATVLARSVVHWGKIDERVKDLLLSISNLSGLEEGWRKDTGAVCDLDILSAVFGTRNKMNEGSGRNEFIDEAAKHPLNKMINHLTDILLERCSKGFNDYIMNIRSFVYEHEANTDIKFALINLDRFQKFLKPPEPVVKFGLKIPYSFFALDDTLIDVNTDLTPGDLKWLGVSQENTLPRKELLKLLIDRTCGKIDKDKEIMDFLKLGLSYALNARDIYEQTKKEYFFRSEFGLYRVCKVVEDSIVH